MATVTWCWRRWVARSEEMEWAQWLDEMGYTQRSLAWAPGDPRSQLAVYDKARSRVAWLSERFGGRISAIKPSDWMSQKHRAPLRIAKGFTVYDRRPRKAVPGERRLIIPHGLAFGSGEHATTCLLLRELVRTPPPGRVLDLGTGSGILALAARRLGTAQVVGTDFDPESIRVARRNEARNFGQPRVRWLRTDVRKLGARLRFDLVLANLFSELLIEAAPRIAACLVPAGKLWASGILLSQQDEVIRAYRRTGLQLARETRRGKWVLLCFRKDALSSLRADSK